MPIVNVLSVKQPFASAIVRGLKTEEYRSQRTNLRGSLAIHASATPSKDESAWEEFRELDRSACPCGVILGVVQVLDCVEEVYGGYAWILGTPQLLSEPIQAKGKVGIWKYDLPTSVRLV